MNDILTIHDVRRNIDNIYDYLELANCHILDNSLDMYDIENMRKAYELCRILKVSRWTNTVL